MLIVGGVVTRAYTYLCETASMVYRAWLFWARRVHERTRQLVVARGTGRKHAQHSSELLKGSVPAKAANRIFMIHSSRVSA